MNRKLPPESFGYYVSLGIGRSYQAVADHFQVSKTAVVNLAEREHWQEQLREIDRKAADTATQKAVESVQQVREKHLTIVRAVQKRALDALKMIPITTAIDAVRALDMSIRQERLILGEATDRTTLEVEDVIRREYERWMKPVADNGGAAPTVEPETESNTEPEDDDDAGDPAPQQA